MPKYNGHRSWAARNVALWLGNDEALYRQALDAKRRCHNLTEATKVLLVELPPKTPDGARYTFTSVREALQGIE
jgi:hypothetical protein